MKAVWKLKVPSKINFLWRIFRNRLPSSDNLLSRKLEWMKQIIIANFVYILWKLWNICWSGARLSQKFGTLVMAGLFFSVVLPRSISDHFCQHNLVGANRIKQIRWKFLWCAVVWMICKTRNDIIFNNYEFHLQNLLQGVLFHSWNWIKAYDDSFCYYFSQWCLNTEGC